MKTTEILRIIWEMRSERSRYKSHDLGFVDSVSSSRVDDWADELEAIVCDCITSGNATKPKQHGADPHAKDCAVYLERK